MTIPLNPFLEVNRNTTHDHNLTFRHLWITHNVHGGSNLQIRTVDLVFPFPHHNGGQKIVPVDPVHRFHQRVAIFWHPYRVCGSCRWCRGRRNRGGRFRATHRRRRRRSRQLLARSSAHFFRLHRWHHFAAIAVHHFLQRVAFFWHPCRVHRFCRWCRGLLFLSPSKLHATRNAYVNLAPFGTRPHVWQLLHRAHAVAVVATSTRKDSTTLFDRQLLVLLYVGPFCQGMPSRANLLWFCFSHNRLVCCTRSCRRRGNCCLQLNEENDL